MYIRQISNALSVRVSVFVSNSLVLLLLFVSLHSVQYVSLSSHAAVPFGSMVDVFIIVVSRARIENKQIVS